MKEINVKFCFIKILVAQKMIKQKIFCVFVNKNLTKVEFLLSYE